MQSGVTHAAEAARTEWSRSIAREPDRLLSPEPTAGRSFGLKAVRSPLYRLDQGGLAGVDWDLDSPPAYALPLLGSPMARTHDAMAVISGRVLDDDDDDDAPCVLHFDIGSRPTRRSVADHSRHVTATPSWPPAWSPGSTGLVEPFASGVCSSCIGTTGLFFDHDYAP